MSSSPTLDPQPDSVSPTTTMPTSPLSTTGSLRWMDQDNQNAPSSTLNGSKLPVSQSQRLDAGRSGTWTCCHCTTTATVYLRGGKHPLGSLSCQCPHKPCENCKFGGSLRHFVPITEPLRVEIAAIGPGRLDSGNGKENVKEIPYGFICGGCGLSWRAEELKRQGLKKGRSLIRDVHEHSIANNSNSKSKSNKHKLKPHEGRLRKSQSLMNLGLSGFHRRTQSVAPPSAPVPEDRGRSREREKDAHSDAKSAVVKFSGIQCLCGCVSDLETCVCFHCVTELVTGPKGTMQINEVAGVAKGKEKEKELEKRREKGPDRGRHTDEKLLAMGHDSKEIKVCGGRIVHPNPLRSNPVD